MPSPTGADEYLDHYLSNVSHAYINDPANLRARAIFPPISVNQQTGYIGEYDRGDWLRDEMQMRAPATESAGGDYDVSKTAYRANVWAYHKDVAREELVNAEAPYRPLADATTFVTSKRALKMEAEFISNFFTTSVWTGSSTGGDLAGGTNFDYFDDPAGDIFDAIEDQREAIAGATGLEGNVFVCNRRVWRAIKNHPDVLARVSGGATTGTPAMVTRAQVAALFEVDRIEVLGGVKNSGPRDGTDSVAFMAGNHALLCHVPDTPGLYTPSAGYVVEWAGLGVNGQAVTTEDVPLKKAIRVEIEAAFQMLAVGPILGAFFENATSN